MISPPFSVMMDNGNRRGMSQIPFLPGCNRFSRTVKEITWKVPYMIDLQDKSCCPTLEEIGGYIRTPVFLQFCSQMKEGFQCKEKIEFSSCSWEPGWNIKFKKSGKTLCTIYPRESYFTVMVVVGRKEKETLEAILPECTAQIREIYDRTEEGNGQKWLMIDLEDQDKMYRDVFRLIEIRRGQPARWEKGK